MDYHNGKETKKSFKKEKSKKTRKKEKIQSPTKEIVFFLLTGFLRQVSHLSETWFVYDNIEKYVFQEMVFTRRSYYKKT